MSKAMQKKIEAVNGKTSRAAIMDLHEKLTALEDKAQAKYDEAMQEVAKLREQLDENSNKEADNG